MKLGVCYYPEHWPEERWAIDALMMRELQLDYVRIAEFAWSLMEPAAGEYDWGWLDRAIDTLAAEGLPVILCTPTATPPAWLTRSHPDILRMDSNRQYRDHGTRRHVCPNSPVYQKYSRQIVTAMAERYGDDPRIVGWQIDNEFGGGKTGRCYCPFCQTAFQTWLEIRYHSLEALNEAWGTPFWSQTYTAWDEITPPHDGINYKNPSHLLDFYRFSSDSLVSYQQEQIDLLRVKSPDRFITHNFMGLFLDVEQFDLAHSLDFATWDAYPTGFPDRQRAMLYPLDWDAQRNRPVYAYDVGEPEIIQMANDLIRGLKQQPFWIMEQQCGHINWADVNPGVRPGTPRLWTWLSMAAGADTVVYFRWRATLLSHEQYHSGLLRHDGTPDVGFGDVKRLAEERDLLAALTEKPPQPEVAMVFDYDSLWALTINPHRRDFSYLRLQFAFYHALQRLGIPVDLVSLKSDLTRYKLVLGGPLHIVSEQEAETLHHYVEMGGNLLLGIRSGFKNDSSVVTDQPLPGLLHNLTGATVTHWQSLPEEATLPLRSIWPKISGAAGYWTEFLQPVGDTARVLASYESGEAALVANPHGSGQTFYLGWYPTIEQAKGLLETVADQLSIERLAYLPDGVLAAKRGNHTILLNFTDQSHEIVAAEQTVAVGPRDVKVVES